MKIIEWVTLTDFPIFNQPLCFLSFLVMKYHSLNGGVGTYLLIHKVWSFVLVLAFNLPNFIFSIFFKVRIYFLSFESESESSSLISNLLQPHGLYSPWNSSGQNTEMGSLSLLQDIFQTQGLNPGLPTLQADSLPAEPAGKPFIEKDFGAMHFTLVTSFNDTYSFWYLVFLLLWSLRNSKDSVCIFVFNQSCLIQCTISVSR